MGKMLTYLMLRQETKLRFPTSICRQEEVTVTENSDANGQWIAGAEAMQEFSLTKRPVVDTFKLYVDGREIIPSAAWALDYSGEFVKLKLDKSYFTMGSTVEGSLYYEKSTSYTLKFVLKAISAV